MYPIWKCQTLYVGICFVKVKQISLCLLRDTFMEFFTLLSDWINFSKMLYSPREFSFLATIFCSSLTRAGIPSLFDSHIVYASVFVEKTATYLVHMPRAVTLPNIFLFGFFRPVSPPISPLKTLNIPRGFSFANTAIEGCSSTPMTSATRSDTHKKKNTSLHKHHVSLREHVMRAAFLKSIRHAEKVRAQEGGWKKVPSPLASRGCHDIEV